MKFFVTMKDPDTLSDAIEDKLSESLEGFDEEEAHALKMIRSDRAHEVASLWFEYGEYLTIEIDTDNKTARVVSVAELEKNR